MEYKVKILDIEELAPEVKKFIVEKPINYSFKPGQSTIISINKPGFEKKKRSFSMTSINKNKELEFIIKIYNDREGITKEIDKLKVGDILLIGIPFGKIEYKGKGYFIAGGVGIAPFISIFRHLEDDKELDKNFLIYSNRTHKDIVIEKELKRMFKNNIKFVLTREEKSGFYNKRIDENFLMETVKDFNSYFYICGPRQFVTDIKEILANIGVKKEKIIFEGMS